MRTMVSLQVLVSIAVALVAAAIAGHDAGWSALLGGAACVVPNALFAVRLAAIARRPGGATVASFFFGEFIKLALTVTFLVAIAMMYRNLNWLALIVGFIAGLKSYFFSFLLDRHP